MTAREKNGEWQVGQSLWFQPNDSRYAGYETAIEKVGRDWILCNNGNRFPRDWKAKNFTRPMTADGGRYSSSGRFYVSKEAFTAEREICSAWMRFQKLISQQYQPPQGITLEQIRTASDVLGLFAKAVQP